MSRWDLPPRQRQAGGGDRCPDTAALEAAVRPTAPLRQAELAGDRARHGEPQRHLAGQGAGERTSNCSIAEREGPIFTAVVSGFVRQPIAAVSSQPDQPGARWRANPRTASRAYRAAFDAQPIRTSSTRDPAGRALRQNTAFGAPAAAPDRVQRPQAFIDEHRDRSGMADRRDAATANPRGPHEGGVGLPTARPIRRRPFSSSTRPGDEAGVLRAPQHDGKIIAPISRAASTAVRVFAANSDNAGLIPRRERLLDALNGGKGRR